MSAVFSTLASSDDESCKTEPEKETPSVVASFTRSTEYNYVGGNSHTVKNKWSASDGESSSSSMDCGDEEDALPWTIKEELTAEDFEEKRFSSSLRKGLSDGKINPTTSILPVHKHLYQHEENVSVTTSSDDFLDETIHQKVIPLSHRQLYQQKENISVASSLPSNSLRKAALIRPDTESYVHCSSPSLNPTTVGSSRNDDKIRRENRHLKKEVYQLREEARKKDALISILESQIMALVVGNSSDKSKNNGSSSIYSNSSTVKNDKKAADGEDDDIDSVIESAPEWKESSTIFTVSSAASSLNPPKRINIEMRYPPAQAKESRKQNSYLPPKQSSRKTCFQKSTAAIKALPRELSISNHQRHYLFDDDDDINDEKNQEEPPSETYEVTKMEFIDAYSSRGIYSGTVQRATQMPHGKGKMVYHRGGRVGGRYYDGDWHVGHWHGHGTLRDTSGDIYEGQMVNDLREGIGTVQFTDGRIFQGIFHEDDAFNGTMSYIDGAQYEGELHHGNRHGFGVYRFSDGSYYQGESVMNLFEGKGKMTWSDGGWYEGDWSKGEIHGFGKEYRPDGSLRHDGRWVKGVPIRVRNHCQR